LYCSPQDGKGRETDKRESHRFFEEKGGGKKQKGRGGMLVGKNFSFHDGDGLKRKEARSTCLRPKS